jgi:putative transposase
VTAERRFARIIASEVLRRVWRPRAENPQATSGSYFPAFLGPRKTTERALVAVNQEAWILGVSTRKVDNLVQAMGMSGISKRQVAKICEERRIAGEQPYLWLDATYLKVREGGR